VQRRRGSGSPVGCSGIRVVSSGPQRPRATGGGGTKPRNLLPHQAFPAPCLSASVTRQPSSIRDMPARPMMQSHGYRRYSLLTMRRLRSSTVLWTQSPHSSNSRLRAQSAKRPGHCPHCAGTKLSRKGTRTNKLETVQLWQCLTCGRVFTPAPAELRMTAPDGLDPQTADMGMAGRNLHASRQ
jgi:hypothetical protein